MLEQKLGHKTDTDTTITGCLLTAISFLITPLSWILSGWVLTQLWQWFVIPLFAVRAISIPEAIGLCITVGFLTYQYSYKKRNTEEVVASLIFGILITFVSPLLSLAMGYIVYQFIK